MSSNRTIIPGMESPYGNQPTQNDNIGGGCQASHGGTCVPNGIPNSMGEPVYGQAPQKPIVGFLYSISKSNVGEFWPLHIGSNTIGRSPNCDICLQEGTVSENHATLVVRVMKNPEKVIASVCDSSSTIGTMINGESLGFDQRECINGDIITIGAHYDLLFILIDAKQIGLKVCSEFIPLQNTGRIPVSPLGRNVSSPTVDIPSNPYAAPVGNTPKRTRGFEDTDTPQTGGTQGMPSLDNNTHGNDGQSGGRTIFM